MAQPTTRAAARNARSPFLPDGVSSFLKRRLTETGGALVMAFGAAIVLALLTYDPADPSWNMAGAGADAPVDNLLGLAGSYTADVLIQSLGLAAFPLGFVPMAWGWRVIRRRGLGRVWLRILSLLLGVLAAAIALAPFADLDGWPDGVTLGGAAGRLMMARLADTLVVLGGTFDRAWIALAASALALAALAGAIGMSLAEWRGAAGGLRRLAGGIQRQGSAGGSPLRASVAGAFKTAGDLVRRTPAAADGNDDEKTERRKRRVEPGLRAPVGIAGPAPEARREGKPAAVVGAKAKPLPEGRRAAAEKQPRLEFEDPDDYELPSLDLLALPDATQRPAALNTDALRVNAEILEGVLADFGVRGEIGKVNPGPVVTLYELEPAPGTKSSRVIGLADDIARSMSAVSVRVAVVPGKNAIGIELPNAKRETVFLRELLASDAYDRSGHKLALMLGKDIGGTPVIADLARMPHLLVAGTTGSGKSVAVNTMILSLLYRLPPEKVRFIMIDPKMLELSIYDGIPHLLSPVVTDPKKAVVALKWTVKEMEDRYRNMSKLGVRNVEGYNQRLREAKARGEMLTRRVQTGFDPDTGKPIFEDQPFDLTELPYIVVIVDEMADLMLVAGKDIEAAIQRLAQMARAAGIHIIMATQRPSVDVITGTIKANFPTRISFQVTSKIDSRTILGEGGAETLLGQGDMLYMAGGGRITRVHGPFVSDQEVEDVVAHLKTQGEPAYNEAVVEDDDGGGFDAMGLGDGEGGSGDELYDRAVAIVARERKASTSFIQRHLQIGYNRAARIIEKMEQEGVVSQANHVGKREVLVGDHGE
ncbi:MAG TPA: DNA translocase FtsK 4TM domain-containing protein [Alphaproteobacteria bacterium]|nr:DNA translocase FtsK 4TM domain-containing protein [Alphaproteobacteria bacterium]